MQTEHSPAVGSIDLLGFLVAGCAAPKEQTYEQVLAAMNPSERQRAEIEVEEYVEYTNEHSK